MSTERIWTSPERFRSSVKDRLKTEAKRKGRPYNELEQEFVRQRFLARVFAAPDSPWILKGGTSMLVRLPGEARYSRDVDLLHGSEAFSKAHAELGSLCDQRAASEIDGGDLFSFQLSEPEVMTGGVAGGKIMVTVYTGATVIGRFPISPQN